MLFFHARAESLRVGGRLDKSRLATCRDYFVFEGLSPRFRGDASVTNLRSHGLWLVPGNTRVTWDQVPDFWRSQALVRSPSLQAAPNGS